MIFCQFIVNDNPVYYKYDPRMEKYFTQMFHSSQLAHQGLLSAKMCQSLSPELLSRLFQTLKKQVIKDHSHQANQSLKIVSLKISQFLGKELSNITQKLGSGKKKDRSAVLTELFFEGYKSLTYIEQIRQKVLSDLKGGILSKPEEYKLLSEVSQILNLGDSQISVINDLSQLQQKASKIRTELISIKKVIGNSLQLEEDDKKKKKKAYNQNLQFRMLIEACIPTIPCPEVQAKTKKILKLPKNKTWFGKKLFRLLLTYNWSTSQMLMLAQQLKAINKVNQLNIQKLKPVVRNAYINIEMYAKQHQDQSLSRAQYEKQNMWKQSGQLKEKEYWQYSIIQSDLPRMDISLFDKLLMNGEEIDIILE